MLDMITRQIWP